MAGRIWVLVPFVLATYFQLTILDLSFPPMSSESFSVVMSLAKIFSRARLKENVGGCSAKTTSGSSPAATGRTSQSAYSLQVKALKEYLPRASMASYSASVRGSGSS